jgi:hypothetical protein
MISRTIFRLCMIAAMLAIALLSVTTALANDVFKYEIFYDFPPTPLYDCGNGSILIEDFDINEDLSLYVDTNGIPIKLNAHLKGSGKFYLDGAPEKYVEESGNWNGVLTEYDQVNDVFLFKDYTGITAKVVVPGYGNILHDTGRHTYQWDMSIGNWGPPIFEAGPKEYLNQDFDEVCNYLAQLP